MSLSFQLYLLDFMIHDEYSPVKLYKSEYFVEAGLLEPKAVLVAISM